MLADLWAGIGFTKWPLAFSCLAVFALAAYSTTQVFRRGAWADPMSKTFVDAILLWGGFATIAGMFGTLVAIASATLTVDAEGAVSATLIWAAVRTAGPGAVFGLLILAGSSMTWFALQFRWRLLEAAEAEDRRRHVAPTRRYGSLGPSGSASPI